MRDLRNLDLNLLKAFEALMDERSVTKAAERLAVSQPAMSGILNRLRENFADPLFVRAQRGIVPTNRALALATPIKQVLSDIQRFLTPEEFNPQTAELTVSIAATDYAFRAVLLPFLTALQKRAPKIKVSAVPINDLQVQHLLMQGQLDLALITPDEAAPDMHVKNLYEEEYVCVLRHDHPLANQTELTLDQFCRLDHALVSYSGGSFSGVTDEALAKLGRSRNVVLSVKNFLILPEILTQTDLIAAVPKRLVKGMTNLKTFTPPLPIQGFTKVLAWHERTHFDPAQKWLRELMVEVCQQG
ncbi:LysR family transcriptional regulator [Pasteurellaceae bacterium LIM206]|nr:LysR family transcriptional regulator [Pasteurellaceae bacterium LIM206]